MSDQNDETKVETNPLLEVEEMQAAEVAAAAAAAAAKAEAVEAELDAALKLADDLEAAATETGDPALVAKAEDARARYERLSERASRRA